MDSEWRRRSQLDVAVAPMVCCWEQWRAVFRRPTRAITVQLDDCPSVLVNTPGHKAGMPACRVGVVRWGARSPRPSACARAWGRAVSAL